MEEFKSIAEFLFGNFDLRIAPIYLVATVVIALAIYLVRDRGATPVSFFAWLFPKDIYLHASHLTDLKIGAVNLGVIFVGLFNATALNTGATLLALAGLTSLTGGALAAGPPTVSEVLVVTLIYAVVTDFCVYWVHRVHHETDILWPFHAVHHSAEVLTPVTVYRKHPLYDLFSTAIKNVVLGLVTGFILFFLTDKISVATVAGANIAYVAFNMLGSNLRHSHVWLSYGPALEHLFISPAQHQIHHSRAPEHRDKNYGEIFAIWDWAFGTLYVPRRRETLDIGLSDSRGQAIAQPHGTLLQLLTVPFIDSGKAIRARVRAGAAARRLEQAREP